jgi:hypothetical protein
VKNERSITAWTMAPVKAPSLPVTITLTRLGPSNGLDDDNLAGACKGVRDELARWLKVDDRDPRVTWLYGQQRTKEWAVQVEVEPTQRSVDRCEHCGGLGFTQRAA